jgi:hypothetical protein
MSMMLERVPREPVWFQVVDVVVTRASSTFILLLFLQFVQTAVAAVLPDDRVDVLYHSYDGGGVEVTGPSILIRKSFAKSFSGYYNYYVDNVSSASIDVLSYASPYTEQRKENSLGLDYVHDKTAINFGATASRENDYDANTTYFSISQDMFGDLTNVTLGYSLGNNIVRNNNDPDFEEPADSRSYRLSVTQVLTKDLILGFAYEAIADEGYLNNPYRSVRYVDSSVPTGFAWQSEVYPQTRTSNAASLRLGYYLPYRASIYGGYRYFSDTWGIDASTYEIGYTHPIGSWYFDINYRYYSQNSADFYSDLFPYFNAQNFLARDKELSTYDSNQFGIGVTYLFAENGWRFIKSGSLNFYYNYMYFNYKDFRNVLDSTPETVGDEPLYTMSANVIRAYVSLWF